MGYVEDVLVPVQAGWSPHRNYFRVYELATDAPQSDVDSALADLPVRWGTASLRQHTGACDRLRACHARAIAVLGDPASRARHRESVEREHRTLVGALRHRLHGAPAMTEQDVGVFTRSGRWSRPDVLGALGVLGAEVREPSALPHPARPKRWATVREHLADLPHVSLWDYLSGTEELRGADTTAAQVEMRRQRLRVSRDRAADAERGVLALVRLWVVEPGGLAAALAFELVEDLTAAACCGYSALRDLAVPRRCAATGLSPDVAYAVWAARDEASWSGGYFTALDERRLSDALAVLESRPLAESWHRVRDSLRAKVDRLTAELASAAQAGGEDAATRYLAVGRELADPAVTEGLLRCPAAAPVAVSSLVDGDAVVVNWQPSPSTAGRIGYQVRRGTTVLAEDTSAPPVVDRDPPFGRPLVYTVTTLRSGVPGNAASTETAVLPEVTDLRLAAEPGIVFATWTRPAGATRVLVSRNGSEVAATPSGFIDQQAEPGAAHVYRVWVDYAGASSEGISASVVCPREPVPVTDLRATASGDVVDLSWTPPDGHLVEIRVLTSPAAALPGLVSLGMAARTGPVVATSRTGHARVPAARIGLTLVPVTVSGFVAAIGPPAALDISAEPVTDLRVVRLGPQVQLSWHWPPWSHEVLVVWRHGTPPAGPDDPAAHRLRVTRTAYLTRGVRVNAPEPGEHWFGVCTIGDGQFGPLATVGSPCPVQIRYRVHGRSRTRTVEVECDTNLPDVVVLAKSGHRPLTPDDGLVLATLPGGRPASRAELTVPPHLPRPVHLRAFALDDTTWMCHPDPRDLVVH
ncbi:MAG TPA: hypothetical protein VF821_00675 [Lentzea sp.]